MTQNNTDHWKAAEIVVSELHAFGFEGFLVGGAVRDILLSRGPKDFDIVTNATPQEVMAIPSFSKSSFTDPAQAFGVTRVRVALDDGSESDLEIATYRRDVEAHLGRKLTKVEFTHIEDDLERRDFTINALALDPHNDFLVDLHGGLDDLDSKTIKFIGDPDKRIAEDPLRILRAVRFRNQLGFEYDPVTKKALIEAVGQGRLDDIAIDRVGQELTRMLLHESRRATFEDMQSLGILDVILPELVATKGVQQPPDHHFEGDVWVHTILALESLADPTARLAWATLLHDIGKVKTFRAPKSAEDRIHFDSHFRVGADMAGTIMARLKFSKKLQEDVSWLVHYHLITDSFAGMSQSRRYHYMANPAFHDLLELHKADLCGSIAADPSNEKDDEIIEGLEKSWLEYRKQAGAEVPSIKQTLGIDGNWLKKEFNIAGGQEMGKVLDQLQADFLDGKIKSIDDARQKVTALLKNK